jgi:GntR family transcriptional regulator/MocR family aminotransferase
LLDWASATGALIIEDDKNCEYSDSVNLIPSLQAIDDMERVIYMRSFGPATSYMTGIAFLVVPNALQVLFRAARFQYGQSAPPAEHYALADLINDGGLEGLIRKTRSRRMHCREQVLSAACCIGTKVKIAPDSNGVFLRLNFQSPIPDALIEESARELSVPLFSSKSCYVGGGLRGEFLLMLSQVDEQSIGLSMQSLAARLDCLERELLALRQANAAVVSTSMPFNAVPVASL